MREVLICCCPKNTSTQFQKTTMISRERIMGTNPRQPVNGILPYGRWMILPCLLALFAFCLSVAASFDCSFFLVHKNISQGQTGFGFQHTSQGSIQVGIWKTQQDWAYAPLANNSRWKDAYATTGWQTYDEALISGSPNCVDWNLSQLGKMPDRPAKFARMLSVFIIFIGIPLVLLMFTYAAYHPLCGIPPSTVEQVSALPQRQNWPEITLVHVMTLSCLIEGFMTLLLLSVLATDACSEDRVESCKLSTAGYLSILGSFSWWGAMVSVWLVGHVASGSESSSSVVVNKKEIQKSDHGSTESSDEEGSSDEEQGDAGEEQGDSDETKR
jgi:hypothetical protein